MGEGRTTSRSAHGRDDKAAAELIARPRFGNHVPYAPTPATNIVGAASQSTYDEHGHAFGYAPFGESHGGVTPSYVGQPTPSNRMMQKRETTAKLRADVRQRALESAQRGERGGGEDGGGASCVCRRVTRKTVVADGARGRAEIRASVRDAREARVPFRNVGPSDDPTDWCNAGNAFRRTVPEFAQA